MAPVCYEEYCDMIQDETGSVVQDGRIPFPGRPRSSLYVHSLFRNRSGSATLATLRQRVKEALRTSQTTPHVHTAQQIMAQGPLLPLVKSRAYFKNRHSRPVHHPLIIGVDGAPHVGLQVRVSGAKGQNFVVNESLIRATGALESMLRVQAVRNLADLLPPEITVGVVSANSRPSSLRDHINLLSNTGVAVTAFGRCLDSALVLLPEFVTAVQQSLGCAREDLRFACVHKKHLYAADAAALGSLLHMDWHIAKHFDSESSDFISARAFRLL